MSQKFRLTLQLRVEPLDQTGYPNGREGLSVEDRVDLGEAGFMEIAATLGKFHDLAETMKKAAGE